ncbi:MAG: acyltransferase domain-containing protein [Armatimonadetes bacterium]|nr:acyltransferase domain-containing protein [Armatimonadota bacterium]
MLPGATDVEQYWENILNRVDSVTEVPHDRWDPDIYFDPETRGGDHTYSKWGGFLSDVPFDPLEFGIPPRSLYTIEPVHLLALEVTKRALRDAGYERRTYPRERTAVVFGAGGGSSDLSNAFGFRGQLAHFFSAKEGLPDGRQLLAQIEDTLPQWCEDTFPGVLINVIAGRVANRFNFGGANFTVDAACASSLAAVDAAVKELQLGHADVAIAGGADTTQDIFSYLLFSNSLVLSPRGRCRTFDETADGIAIGEGVAAVVLKRLADAERDGDHIYAVIRGIAGSSDGRALGLTAPNLAGQARAVRMAYEHAQLSPATVELVEAHGTGTAVGDRTEVEALASIYQAAGASVGQVAIGSVKSNIGHTKCAAGLASLIKTARAIDSRVLPPTLHVETPNRKAGFGTNPFYPNREPRPWLDGRHAHPRRAAVSAFGFGGTNFHLVMEEYARDHLPKRAATVHRSSELLVWRAADGAELERELTRLIDALAAGAEPELHDLAYSLSLRAGRRSGGVTLAIVVASREALPEQLALALELLAGEVQPEPAALKGVYHAAQPLLAGGGKLALLFPGQGSQTPFMLSELAVHFEPVRETLERADVLLTESFPQGLSHYLYPPSAYSKEDQEAQAAALTATEVAQPALGACSTAMLHLLRAFGVRGDLAAGHSYGEYVALYAADSIDFETLLRLSVARGRAIADAGGDLHGGMVAVRADAAATEEVLAGLDGITLANLNSPQQTVIAGSDEALDAALARLKERGLQARHVPVACAFHSPLVAPAADRLHAALEQAGFGPRTFPVYSNPAPRCSSRSGRAAS